MNALVKSIAFTTIGLAIATTSASAEQLNNPDNTTSHAKTVQLNSPIAQKYPPGLLSQTKSTRFINGMIILRMRMVEAAEDALQSQDPEIKRMAQDVIKTSNVEIKKMMKIREGFSLYQDS